MHIAYQLEYIHYLGIRIKVGLYLFALEEWWFIVGRDYSCFEIHPSNAIGVPVNEPERDRIALVLTNHSHAVP